MKACLGAAKLAVAFALLFLATAMVWTIITLPLSFDPRNAIVPVAVGFGTGMALFTVFSRFLVVYVFGHELTHWVAAKCFLRKTGTFRISSRGGSVAVERPNVWIVLAPYFVPVYTIIWIGLYGTFRFFVPGPGDAVRGFFYDRFVMRVFYGGVGFTYAFHVVLTISALVREQQDLRVYGRVFSMSLIWFCNVSLLFITLAIAGQQFDYAGKLLLGRLQLQWQFCVVLATVIAEKVSTLS